MNPGYILLGLFGLIVGAYLYKQYKRTHIHDISILQPSKLRTDLLYGYYGCLNDQAKETLDHTNLLWESQFQGQEKASENILTSKTFTVLDIAPQIMLKFAESGRNYKIHPDAESRLKVLFDYLQGTGALQYVKAIYPMDEPNTNVRSEDDLKTGIDIIRKVAANYPELTGFKLLVIYAAAPETFECFSEFDYVGVDDYDNKSQIFVNGTYGHLRSKLDLNRQKTILLPGGAFGQDPTPFMNFAHTNSEVGMVVPFVWFNGFNPNDKWTGIREPNNLLKSSYVFYGKQLTGK